MAPTVLSGFFTLNLVGTVLGDPHPDPCPQVETMPNFNMTRFDGRWFEAKRYITQTERRGKCVKAHHTLYNDTSIKFFDTAIDTVTGKLLESRGSLFEPDPNEPGKLKMTLQAFPIKLDYWILGTDYNTYAAIYSCKEVKSSHVPSAWLLTRAQHPPKSVVKRALNVFVRHQVDTKEFKDTDQTHCKVRVA